MALYIVHYSQIGASHDKPNGKVCQDASLYKWIEEGKVLVASVADGHGSDACLYSDEGSRTATEIFCDSISELYQNYKDKGELRAFLYREGSVFIAKTLVRAWQEKIKEHHREQERDFPMTEDGTAEDEHELYHLYGTTLLGMLITPEFHFAFQLGDGDITRIVKGETAPILESDGMLGVETHSLCEKEPWKYAHSAIIYTEDDEEEFAYIMTTDGFKNSHASTEDYLKSCRDYVEMVKCYGMEAIGENLPGWLSETSKIGCGDDITVAVISSFDKIEGYLEETQPKEEDEPGRAETTETVALSEVSAEQAGNQPENTQGNPAEEQMPVPETEEIISGNAETTVDAEMPSTDDTARLFTENVPACNADITADPEEQATEEKTAEEALTNGDISIQTET